MAHVCFQGQGRGAAIALALASWTSRPLARAPRVADGWRLPVAWEAVQSLGAGWRHGPWTGQWETPVPAGPAAPAALVLLTHDQGGRVALDLDPSHDGRRRAWWMTQTHVRCLSQEWDGLAAVLAQGPQALEQAVRAAAQPPQRVDPAQYPFDPISRQWLDQVDRAMAGVAWAVWDIGETNREMDVAGAWLRHPNAPLFAGPVA